ncbi:hypothetical protein [Algoriphagus persicinus]|uniref:hypothetical protein n=1 Tax=Algoriphagus persicinus TaxID=3108754 RepID=UPI002B3F0E86|nr:hypothetical protein [Algoriphagus sp. E1-3-M2]MEB2783275.1 hypothetical protein [Algoriphagus sp. E1-3-M2]
MKDNLSAILFAVAIVIASIVLGNAVINRNRPQGTINVTGLGESNFTSDLVVWEGNFSDLISANMGIFQITGQNSGEDYSWGGTFNTADKNKTASITMKLIFEVD